jgi:hypothetical protein
MHLCARSAVMSDIKLSPFYGVHGDRSSPRKAAVYSIDGQEDYGINRLTICEPAYHTSAIALPYLQSQVLRSICLER